MLETPDLEGLLQDLSSTLTEEESIPEALRVVGMLIRGTSAHAQALGQSMANVVQACRQVWLSQANLLYQDCMAVIKPGLRRSPPVCCPRGTHKSKPRSPAILS